MKKTYLYTFLGINLIAIENSMTIVTNLGSILLPASIVNMMHAFGWTMCASIFTEGIVISFLTMILERRMLWKQWREELIFLTPYSVLMQVFATVWRWWGIDKLDFIAPLIVIGICFFRNHTVYALHIGTLVGLLIQNRFTSFCQIAYEKYLHV